MFKIILVLHERGGAYELEYDVCCCVSRISFKTFVPLWKNLINYLFLSPWGNCNFIISYHKKYYIGFGIQQHNTKLTDYKDPIIPIVFHLLHHLNDLLNLFPRIFENICLVTPTYQGIFNAFELFHEPSLC